MKKSLFIAIGIVIIIIGGVFLYRNYYSGQEGIDMKDIQTEEQDFEPDDAGGPQIMIEDENAGEEEIVYIEPMRALEKQSVAMVIAFKDFRDIEYFTPRQYFVAAGAEVKTVSTERGIAEGADGGKVAVDLLIEEVNPADFDAVVFIGGPGALKYLDNEKSYNLIKNTLGENKLLGAICIAPVILANAGALEGKEATVWTSDADKSAIKILEDQGAVFKDSPFVKDGNIVTGSGPEAADAFAITIVEVLTGI